MDTASMHDRTMGVGAGSVEAPRAHDGDTVRALGHLAFAHVLGMLLALTAGVLLERSMTEDRWGAAAAVCLGAAAALILVARRGYRRTLIEAGKRRGLSPERAREEAARRIARHTELRDPSPW